jgi:AcrR family transcriptional regulator
LVPLRERFRREVAGAIAKAAEEVFAEQGLHSAHVGHIARRAGVAVGTLYNYYKDRDALLAALLRERCDGLERALKDSTAKLAAEPVRVQLVAYVEAYFAFFTLHRPYFKILLEGELTQLQAAYPESAAIPTRCHRAIFEHFEALLARAVAKGELRDDHADLYPWLLLGMMRSLAIRDIRKYKPYEAADGAEIVAIFLRGAEA